MVKFGLCPGSADLIGWLAPSGRFLAIEVKAGRDKMSENQQNWRAVLEAGGGLYFVARDVPECIAAIAATVN